MPVSTRSVSSSPKASRRRVLCPGDDTPAAVFDRLVQPHSSRFKPLADASERRRAEPASCRAAIARVASVIARQDQAFLRNVAPEMNVIPPGADAMAVGTRQQIMTMQTPLVNHRPSAYSTTAAAIRREADDDMETDLAFGAEKMAFSCTKPASKGDYIGDGSRAAGALSEIRVSRKRPFREELETVKEEAGSSARIMVYVRLRPMSKNEKEAGARSCVRIVNKRDVYLTEFALETDYLRLKRLKGRHFVFDASFPDMTGQLEVYNTSTAELVEGVLQGRNGSVFCYGATGAGKTHTMLGTLQSPGVMVLALKDLFSKLSQRSREGDYLVRLSYLEVYNESVRDLLSPGRPLVLREDSKQGTIAAGLTQYQAHSADEVMALLQQGNQNRTTEPTRQNETSSRSHAILQVTVEYKMQQESRWICRSGKLSLIDLAGSERALATDQRTIRSLEGANINRSLLALSSCINALVEAKKHIPFRNSKLTQLLKDSLGGACQTSMIANISPSNLSFGETQNTLHWADRAKQIRTKVCDVSEEIQVPESGTEQAKLLLELQKENQQLRMQLVRLQQKLLTMESKLLSMEAPPQEENGVAAMAAQLREERRTVEELRRKVQCLEKEKEQCVSNHGSQLRQKDEFIRNLYARMDNRSEDMVVERPAACKATETEREVERRVTRSSSKDAALRTARNGGNASPARANSKRSKAEVYATPQRGKANTMNVNNSSNNNSSWNGNGYGDNSKGGGIMAAVMANALCTPRATRRSTRKGVEEKDVEVGGRGMIHDADGENSNKGGRIGSLLLRQQQQHQQGQQQARRLSRIPHPPPSKMATTPLVSNSKRRKELLAAAGGEGGDTRKRTFWDITNANSPSAPSARCTRSNTAATPSMLLQPGFLGGRRSLALG